MYSDVMVAKISKTWLLREKEITVYKTVSVISSSSLMLNAKLPVPVILEKFVFLPFKNNITWSLSAGAAVAFTIFPSGAVYTSI